MLEGSHACCLQWLPLKWHYLPTVAMQWYLRYHKLIVNLKIGNKSEVSDGVSCSFYMVATVQHLYILPV